MGRRRYVISILIGAILLTATACTAEENPTQSGGTVFPDGAVSAALRKLPQVSTTPMPTARLADGLIPPTNRWFSGLVFGDAPQPVFPLPLSFSLTGTGFDFGVPAVVTGADTISAGPSSDVSAEFPTAVTSTVTAYDDASVTIELRDAGDTALGSVTIAEGSPIVSFTPASTTTIRLATPPAAAGSGGLFTATVGDREYGIITAGTVHGSELAVAKGDTVTWFAVPTGHDAKELVSSAHGVAKVAGTYSVAARKATTTLAYGTSDAKETLIAVLPHQYSSLAAPAASSCDLGTYETVYGTMHLCAGRTLSWTVPLLKPADTLALDAVDGSTKDTIRAQLAADVKLPAKLPDDTYFGGKALYRLANLLQLADQLNDTDSAAIARKRLVAALTDWTTADRCAKATTRCFVYDPAVKGIVGKVSSFGSDQFNDHHFHYGYLLYAASVAIADDPKLADRLSPVMNLVAADLATDGASSYFPDHRVFDTYAGHSWASGYVPFRDGNNQESSSEAIAAWNGLALWADITKNAALGVEARWMLANEAATAQAYWLGFDASESVYKGYGHSIVSLNWGDKRDYSTWFSAEPNAKLGIQLIPMMPAADYLAGDAGRIADNLREAAAGGYDVQFGDYMLMYDGLQSRSAAADAYARAAHASVLIDDANSKTYLLAFLASHAAR
ncbi:glycosyl hydrolase [Microbacterium deminutum]|uniref:glucan endo-1,3-beta-D-glucosidase n=1 Tax=Microbacterium deminutum TaxID=344164 RepID=A0ABN2QIY2_9MICO